VPALGTAVGSLDVDRGGARQEAKCLRRRRHRDSEGRAAEDLAIRAVADAYALWVHFSLVRDLPAVARTIYLHTWSGNEWTGGGQWRDMSGNGALRPLANQADDDHDETDAANDSADRSIPDSMISQDHDIAGVGEQVAGVRVG